METVSTRIEHKRNKVESVVLTDEQGNFIEGRTYKYYAPYLKKIEKVSVTEGERLSRIIPLCFEHEKQMLELVKSRELPGVRLVRDYPELMLEIEYVAGNTLAHHLASGGTHSESRMLAASAVSCIASHNNAGIVLNDTHPSNFLVSPQGTVLFCDYGNASSAEHPFVSPPLAIGNRKDETYFSEEQDKAFKADHGMDRRHCSAPYPPDKLKANGLDCKGDFYVLAKHLLDLEPGTFDKDLREILKRMKQGRYQSAEAILKDLQLGTPDIGDVEQPVQADRHSRRLMGWDWSPSFRMPRWAIATTAGLCLATGFGVAEMQGGFMQVFVNENRPMPASVQADASLQAPKEPEKPAEQPVDVRKPATAPSEIREEPQTQLQAATPIVKPFNDVKSAEAQMLEKARLDVASTDTATVLRGIEVLQQLSRHTSPVSSQALEALGKQIERLENAAPSEPERQRLQLIASYGHSRAHYLLARWLEEGKGIDGGRDLPEAYRHYVKASRKVKKASEAIAGLERTAQTIVRNPPDKGELFRLLLAIAERPKNSQAQAAVGLIYAEGKYGQVRNKELAAKYLRKSLSNGFADARNVMRKHGIKG
jgi:serine/threonine protein kinase